MRFPSRQPDSRDIAAALFGLAEPSFAAALERLPFSTWAVDRDLRFTYVRSPLDPAVDRSRFVGRTIEEMTDFEDVESSVEAHRRVLAGERVEIHLRRCDRLFRCWIVPVTEGDEVIGAVGCGIDVTDGAETIELLRRSEDRLALAQAAAHLGSWDVDLETGALTCTEELRRIFGFDEMHHVTKTDELWAQVHPEDAERMRTALEVARRTAHPFQLDTRVVRADGVERWVEHRGEYRYRDGEAVGVVGTCLDITERKLAETMLAFQSHYDALTQLPNRKLLIDRLHQAIAASERTGALLAVFVVDIDRFKIINDTLGHASGDALLRAAAPRIVASLRDSDTVARAGGDEFVIVRPSVGSPEEAARLAQDLCDTLAEPFDIENRELYVTASVGISLSPTDGETPDQLVRNADAAMYRAKESGRNTFCFYAASIHARAVDRLVLENQLRRALDNGEFALHYQPIVDATERIVAVETLLRWNHPLLGTIRPDAFIPLCEEIGLIVPIGRWVLRTAIAQMTKWRASGIAPQRLAINVSGRQLAVTEFPRFVAETLRDFDYRPNALELEITESAVMADTAMAGAALAELKSLGVRICLDDFGTGYSSLSYLKHFRVDALKIDRSFVRDLPHDRTDAAIVSAVVALGEAMGVRVVSEGVETAAQAALVRKLGTHELQGYYFWRPLPANEIEAVLRGESRGESRLHAG